LSLFAVSNHLPKPVFPAVSDQLHISQPVHSPTLTALIIVQQTLDMTEIKAQFIPVYIKHIFCNPQ
jgi:hypothetical protein